MKIIITKNYEEMSKEAAKLIAAEVLTKPNALLGLATGSTPKGTYDELVNMYEEGNIELSEVKTVNLDEYVGLSGTHEQSFRYYMDHVFFEKTNIKRENTHVPNGMTSDYEEESQRYMEIIDSNGGIDIQLLGIGLDGHVGFNEPEDKFSRGLVCTELTESTIQANSRFFESLEEVPKKALTMGIQPIMQAKKIVLMASGEEKAEIMKKALFGEIRPQIPASALQMHRDVIVLADQAAGKYLIEKTSC